MQEADHILLPLLDGTHALAQVARLDQDRALLLLTRSQLARDARSVPLSDPQVVAVLCLSRPDLDATGWPVIGYHPIPRIAPYCNQALSDMTCHDPAVIEAFINALHGLYPWDGFPDPDFFSALLRDPDIKPTKARLSQELNIPN